MTHDKDFKGLVRAHARGTGLRYTAARADLLARSNGVRPARPAGKPSGAQPHPGVLQLMQQLHPIWLEGVAAAYRCAIRGEHNLFSGTMVLRELGMILPSLRPLARRGIIEKQGETTRRGKRAWYTMPEPESVLAALRQLGYDPALVAERRWMSPEMRWFSAVAGTNELKELDTQLMIALDDTDDPEDRELLQTLRRQLHMHAFGAPPPSRK